MEHSRVSVLESLVVGWIKKRDSAKEGEIKPTWTSWAPPAAVSVCDVMMFVLFHFQAFKDRTNTWFLLIPIEEQNK